MSESIATLLSIAGPPIRTPVAPTAALDGWGARGAELAALLALRNGFYAYESALLVRPLQNSQPPLGLVEWNASDLWRAEYEIDLEDALFFAEDVFADQFCLRGDSVCRFRSECGEFKEAWPSLEAWARHLLDDYEYATGQRLAHEWQLRDGQLPVGRRLVGKLPFVLNGKYELENLYCAADVDAMRFYGALATQVRALPEGAEVVITTDRA